MKHVPELDGLRGLAVILVIFSHFHGLFGIHHGALGVDIFFTLSGFLITRILVSEVRESGSVGFLNFYARRSLRLAPALLAMIVATTAFYMVWGVPFWAIVKMAGPSALYFVNWVSAYSLWRFGAFGHTWSLAIEEQFYLVWPVMLLCAARIFGLRRLAWFALGLAGIALAHRLMMLGNGASVARIANGLDTRSDGILIGAALGAFAALHSIKGGLLRLAGAGGLAYLLFVLVYEPHWYYGLGITSVAVAVACVIANAVAGGESFANRLLRQHYLRLTGKLSYGLYIWHYPIVTIFWMLFDEKAMRRTSVQVIDLFILLPITCIVCWASYRWVEQPALRLKSRFKPETGRTDAGFACQGKPAGT